MQNLLDDKRYRIKYLYLLDVEPAINRIRNSTIYQDFENNKKDNLDSFFSTLFLEIVQISDRYTKFIFEPFTSSFFSPISNPFLLTLCQICLYHHCILHGFEKALKEADEPELYIPLTSSTEKKIRKNGMDGKFVNPWKYDSSEYLSSLAQNYNYRYKYFKNNKITYSRKLLENLSKKRDSLGHLCVNEFLLYIAFFLFKDDNIRLFDKVLQSDRKRRDFFTKYDQLRISSYNWKNSLLNTDKIFFDSYMEKHYAFLLQQYLVSFLSDLDDNKYPQITSTKEGLLEVLRDYVFSMPMTYNRSVFLEYACQSYSADFNSSYPQKPTNKAVIINYAAPSNVDSRYGKDILTISSFLRTLKYITIPLLEDLWDIITDSLGIINLDEYSFFINKHYNELTFDFTKLPKTLMPSEKEVTLYTAKTQNYIVSLFILTMNNIYSYIQEYEYKDIPKINLTFNNAELLMKIIKENCDLSLSKENDWFDLLFDRGTTEGNASTNYQLNQLLNIYEFSNILNPKLINGMPWD